MRLFSKYADWLIDDPSEPLELEGLVISYIPNMTVAEWEAKTLSPNLQQSSSKAPKPPANIM